MATLVACCMSLLIWSIFSVTVVPFFIIMLTIRWIVSKMVSLCSTKFDKIVTSYSSLFARFSKNSRVYLCVGMDLDGDISVQEIQAKFESQVVFQRNSTQNLIRPELQQYYVTFFGYSFWKWDTNFNIKNHVHFLSSDSIWNQKKKGAQEVLEFLDKSVLRRPFPEGQSPWELLVVPNFENSPVYGQDSSSSNSGTLVILRYDHILGDAHASRAILHDFLKYHTNSNTVNPATLKRNDYYGKLSTYFFGPWDYVMTIRKFRAEYHSLPEFAKTQKLVKKSNIGVTPVIPLHFIKKIRRSHSVTFTAVVLTLIARAYERFILKAGYDVPRNFVCFCPRGVPRPVESKMVNLIKVVFVHFLLKTDGFQMFPNAEKSLQEYSNSINASWMFESINYIGSLPKKIVRQLLKVTPEFSSMLTYTNVSFAEDDIFLNEGSNRLRTIIGLGSAEAGGSGFTVYSTSTKSGIRFVFQLNEALVPKNVLSATVLAQFFMEEVEAWNENLV